MDMSDKRAAKSARPCIDPVKVWINADVISMRLSSRTQCVSGA
jgi:hypothetical protein